jgi:hypothetical protein
LAFGALTGGVVWIYYLAIEPYARRFWPDALLGWTRLLSGHVRDPRVGRELLIGLACGAIGVLIDLSKLVPMALGWRIPSLPLGNGLPYLDGLPSRSGSTSSSARCQARLPSRWSSWCFGCC